MPTGDSKYSYNFIDLFAGAGGLSEGFLQAGFKPVAHVEMDEFASRTLETRNAYYYLKSTNNLKIYREYILDRMTRDEFMKQIPASIIKTVINKTMSDETLPTIFKTIDGIMKIRGIEKIDVIVGGPPCQACAAAEIPERNAAVPAGGGMGGAGIEDNPCDAGQLGDLPVEGLPGTDDRAVAEGFADPALHACG